MLVYAVKSGLEYNRFWCF